MHPQSRLPAWLRVGTLGILLHFCLPLPAAELVNVRELGLRVARGFRVTLFADDSLGQDVQAVTCDPVGNVVIGGPGYVRRLEDRDGDGHADDFSTIAESESFIRGLCYTGQELLMVGGGALWRYRDSDGNGNVEGEASQVLQLTTSENGARGIRVGPDGAWYLSGGNESGFDAVSISSPGSPLRKTRGGALLRLDPESGQAEALADGFYNATAFDFDSWGEIMVGDGDLERDSLLPSYDSARVIDIGFGSFYGTLLTGREQGWRLPSDYFDLGEPLQVLGRGAPSAVLCYRHYQFPAFYRNALFIADWAYGRIYLLAPADNPADGYRAPEIFLEAQGVQGFAPTDLTVGPDGSLFVSVGGRGTRGGVYRIDYVADPLQRSLATNWMLAAWTVPHAVLSAPQPQAAWSRARWMTAAAQTGEPAFELVAEDESTLPPLRARAIEVLTEIHGGLTTRTANVVSRSDSPLVRARAAWSLGCVPCEAFAPILLRLSRDLHPLVRRNALEAMMRQRVNLEVGALQDAIQANLTHPLVRIRQSAARLASSLPPPAWKVRWPTATNADPEIKLTTTLAMMWRPETERTQQDALQMATSILRTVDNLEQRLSALRLIMMAFGDWKLEKPSAELYRGYELVSPSQNIILLAPPLVRAIETSFPTTDPVFNFEAARLFAMLEANSPTLPEKLARLLENSNSSDDLFHYLIVFTRLTGLPVTNFTSRLADSLLKLSAVLSSSPRLPGYHWPNRYRELVETLIGMDPALPQALLNHPKFALPPHVFLARLLGSEHQEPAARLFKKTLDKTPSFPWSPALVELLAVLPDTDIFPLLRRQWNVLPLREPSLLVLSRHAEVVDAEKFGLGLSFANEEVVRASMRALLRLPATGGALVPTMRLHERLLREPNQALLRAEVLALMNYLTHEKITIQEKSTDTDALRRAYAPLREMFNRKYPAHARQLQESEPRAVLAWEKRFPNIEWARGDVMRGQVLYRDLGCQNCHEGWNPLGPDLSSVPRTRPNIDLIRSVVFPSHQVSPAYRATAFRLGNQSYAGMLVHDAPDVVLIRPSPDGLMRITGPELQARQWSARSLMPEGLLDRLNTLQIADLAAYLSAVRR